MVQEFYNQEEEYEEFLSLGNAFVLNDFPKWRRLHQGDCVMLHRAGPALTGLHTSVRKICSYDLNALTDYIRRTIGPEGIAYQKCAFCFKE